MCAVLLKCSLNQNFSFCCCSIRLSSSETSSSTNNVITSTNECTLASLTFETLHDRTSDKLFLLDTYTVGLLSSSEFSLRLYQLNVYQRSLTLLRTKYFRGGDVPTDACGDKFKHIYVVFPDTNKIVKYALNSSSPLVNSLRLTNRSASSSSSSLNSLVIRELVSIRDPDFSPSTIACHDDLVYVGERANKHLRVYDRLLRLVRIIHLQGLVVSSHVAIAVNQNVRVLMDGSDSLAVFQPIQQPPLDHHSKIHHHNHQQNHRKKFSLRPESNKASVCHFYTNMECLEDVSVAIESTETSENTSEQTTTETSSSIFTADSCSGEIRKFVFERGHKVSESARFQLDASAGDGTPISVVANQLGHVFVLTDLPRRLIVLDQRECLSRSRSAENSTSALS